MAIQATKETLDIFAQSHVEKWSQDYMKALAEFDPKAQLSEASKYFLNATVEDDTLILNLEGFIDSLFGTGSQDFSKALAEEPELDVVVNVNSMGGSFFEGISIMNRLAQRADKTNVTANVTGQAASAASIVLLGADEIMMGKGSSIFIHEVRAFVGGPASFLRSVADELDAATDQLAELYAERTGIEADEIKDMLANDTTLYAKDAVKKNFADGEMQNRGKKKKEPSNVKPLNQEQHRAMAILALRKQTLGE